LFCRAQAWFENLTTLSKIEGRRRHVQNQVQSGRDKEESPPVSTLGQF
jgi:hypothetical protein